MHDYIHVSLTCTMCIYEWLCVCALVHESCITHMYIHVSVSLTCTMCICVYLYHVLVHELVLLAHPLRRVLARLAPHQGVLELLDHVPVQVLAVCVCVCERESE